MASKFCTHIKVTGVRCDSPALRGEQFCYFHQRMLRTVRVPDSRIRHTALLEDEASIQVSLMEVVNALLRGTIELKRGELILRALNTAVRNIRRVRFDLHQEDMVREIPNYPDPPQSELEEQAAAKVVRRPTRPPTREEVARSRAAMLAEYYADVNKSSSPSESKTVATANAAANETTPVPLQARVATDAFVRPPNVANAVNVGTAAPGCPGGPEVSGRSAVAPKLASTSPNKSHRPQAAEKCETRSSEGAQECSPRRKPWVSAKNMEASPGWGERKLMAEECTGPSVAPTPRAFRMTNEKQAACGSGLTSRSIRVRLTRARGKLKRPPRQGNRGRTTGTGTLCSNQAKRSKSLQEVSTS